MWLRIAWTVQLLWGVTNWNWTHTNEKVWIEQFIGWVTWPWWGGSGEGVSEITQLFLPQLGGHSAALLASSGNFFAPTSFLLPPSLPPPKLGLLRIARRRKLDGGKYITVQMTAPIDGHAITDGEDDFSLTFYIFFSQIWGKQDNPAWCGWQHTYKMLKKNVGKHFLSWPP